MHFSQDSKLPILIAGAGIGGLAAALALLRRGFDVEIYEQAEELREVGAGVQISPNGSRVLANLGVLEEVRATSCETEGKEIRLWSTGQTWKLFDLGAEAVRRFGYSYFTAYRVDLHNALVEGVRSIKPDAIHLASRCIGFEQNKHGVVLHLESGESTRGKALIGADGIHSTIRSQLFGSDRATFADMMAWRAVIPMEKVPQHLRRPVGTNWVGPGGHVIHYPLRRGELMNFVGYLERTGWVAESWNIRGTTADCAADFIGWHDDVQELIQAIDAPFKWGIVRRPPLSKWTVKRVTLLGDACHAMFPLLAQGANVALEDGVVLARCLEHDRDVETALQRYELARRERAYRIVDGSAENIWRFHNRALADPIEGPAFISREWATNRVQARYDWIFEYDAATAPLPAVKQTS
ncbi:FAD-dependent monooxygenase [uncultured Pigmentiphaga sp.]|jgi:2-polyprenyl-6-methoxyphenol hydroxylase and related FAD-dependent oxidoreductases|uniref:FAD-dependent monooxygenase n=1 Tax=uncultured Pigmentiphaga sp. TaxID=340361 RepID=UPI0026032231|nr:FAD-dependent monooxygenase [uncultured Pigmentiphaga sp.]